MTPDDLLKYLSDTFENLQIPHIVVGSMASGVYGEPRMTNDIDVVVSLKIVHTQSILRAFPEPDFYCSEDAVKQAITQQFQFNILHIPSGLKVDVILATNSDFDQSQLARQRLIQTTQKLVRFSSPEDVILKKLFYFQEGGSEKHLRDSAGILKVQKEKIDRTYLQEWVDKLGLQTEWALLLSRLEADSQK